MQHPPFPNFLIIKTSGKPKMSAHFGWVVCPVAHRKVTSFQYPLTRNSFPPPHPRSSASPLSDQLRRTKKKKYQITKRKQLTTHTNQSTTATKRDSGQTPTTPTLASPTSPVVQILPHAACICQCDMSLEHLHEAHRHVCTNLRLREPMLDLGATSLP